MQTFLPKKSPTFGIEYLDYKRLGKQRVETLQIVNALKGKSKGWVSHPATKMWRGYENALIEYGILCCQFWKKLGYDDNVEVQLYFLKTKDPIIYPIWLCDERIYSSHRSNLLRKDFKFYSKYGWVEEPSNLYYWPV